MAVLDDVNNLKKNMESKGYFIEDEIAMKLFLSTQYRGKGISTILLSGAAGAGKTSLVETLANILEAHLEIYQGVPTTSEEALIFDIDVAATVAKDIEHINKKGKLIRAIENTEQKFSILFLDEWEKTRPEMDSFLLDFLQSGRLTGTPLGDFQIKDLSKIMVFIAKNDERELSEPLMRRCRSIALPIPRPDLVRQVLMNTSTDSDKFMMNWILRLYQGQYKKQDKFRKVATIQEMKNALLDDDLLRNSYNETIRKDNAVSWMAQYSDDIDLMNNIVRITPFKYPPKIYKEIGIPETEFIDASVIIKLMIDKFGTNPQAINQKKRFIVWAAMYYASQLDNLNLISNPMTFDDVLNKIKWDSEAKSIKERLCSFFSSYEVSDLKQILTFSPDFIDPRGNRIKLTLDLITTKVR